MTHKEMSEIFAVMLLAYPNAEVFKGGIAKLGPSLHRGSPHQCQRGNRSVSTNDRQVRKPSNDSTCPAFRSRNDRG